jgi:hypothetical protein
MFALLLVSGLTINHLEGGSSIVTQDRITRTSPPPLYTRLRIGMTKEQVEEVLKEEPIGIMRLGFGQQFYRAFFLKANVRTTFDRTTQSLISIEPNVIRSFP